jgi:tetratricopeptide (TPR) repeat protein
MKVYVPLLYSFFLVSFSSLYAQQKMTPSYAENKTYALYIHQDWSELIHVGKEAINNNNDYFYLRMRIGIAYYEQKNYNLAQYHFTKALNFNSKNELTKEYLYYCYLLNGNKEDARKLTEKFSKKLKSKIGISKASKIDFITAETAIKNTDNTDKNEQEELYFNNAFYAQVGLKHFVNNKFSLFHAATFFSQELNTGNIKQYQYYLQGTIPLKKKWSISPAIHLVNLNFEGKPNFETFTEKHNYFVGSFQVKKRIKNIELALGSTFSNITESNQYNHFGNFNYMPFGNSTFIMGITQYMHSVDTPKNYHFSNHTFVYFQPTKFSSVKLSYLKNQNNNIIESNGYLINNSYDLTESRFEMLIDFKISKNTSIYGMYQHEKKRHRIEAFNYNYNLFLVGVKITHE